MTHKVTTCVMIEMKFLSIFYSILIIIEVLIIKKVIRCQVEEKLIHKEGDIYSFSNASSFKAYMNGVDKGIINMEKYPYQAFVRDEEKYLKKLYLKHSAVNASSPLNYEMWLIMNNFGLTSDTQESLHDLKISKRNNVERKQKFLDAVKTGDILLSSRDEGGFVGHVALMVTDYWVLEMKAGHGWQDGSPDSNRRISKSAWFNELMDDWVIIYRCMDDEVAQEAAQWAMHNYYNPSGGFEKTKSVTYKITSDIYSLDPSYCTKLVLQAYFYGTGKKSVITNILNMTKIIAPTSLPKYFAKPYQLVQIGKF